MRLCEGCVTQEHGKGHFEDHDYSLFATFATTCRGCGSQDVACVKCACAQVDVAEHDVRFDLGGPGGHLRLTCYTPGCEGAAAVAYHTEPQAVADGRFARFRKIHPWSQVKDESGGSLQIVFAHSG